MNIINKIKRYIAVKFPLEKNATKRIMSFWQKGGADFEYYKSAEQEQWMQVFWDEQNVFYPLFKNLDLDNLLEIACGTGRHSAKVIGEVKQLYLLDSSKEALHLAQERFSSNSNVHYIHNPTGLGIPDAAILDGSLTAVFSYDAMVHFEKEAVESYVADSFKKLKKGGCALFHHSNYNKNPQGVFTDNPGWRNFMSQDLFISLATNYGFEVIHSKVFAYSCPDSDCITLLKKP